MKRLLYLGIVIIILILLMSCQKLTFPENKEDTLWVAHLKEPLLTIIDVDSGNVKQKVELPFIMKDMVRLPTGDVLVVSQRDEYIWKIDERSKTLKTVAKVGEGASEMVVDSERNVVYISHTLRGEVLIYDIGKETIINTIAVGKHPYSLDMDPSGNFLFVANTKDNTISKIDLNQKEEVTHFSVLSRPNGIYVSESTVYIGGHGDYSSLNKQVFLFNYEGELLSAIEAGLMPVIIEPSKIDHSIFVVSHGDHLIQRIHLETNEVVAETALPYNPYFLLCENEGLYISMLDSNQVALLDAENLEVLKEWDVDAGPHAMLKWREEGDGDPEANLNCRR